MESLAVVGVVLEALLLRDDMVACGFVMREAREGRLESRLDAFAKICEKIWSSGKCLEGRQGGVCVVMRLVRCVVGI